MKFIKRVLYPLHVGVINPLLNLFPFLCINVFYDNQSYIGNALHHKTYLLLWSFSSAFGFYHYSKKIWNQYKIPYQSTFHFLICFSMFLSCTIPYSTNLSFWINDLHVWLAIVSVTLFILEWVKLFFSPIYYLKDSFKKLLHLLMFVFSISGLILFSIGHVTSICEISFSVLVNIVLVYGVLKKPA